MSARARIVLAVSVTVLLVAMIAATIVNRIGHWQERGIAGLSYVEMRSGSPGPAVFGAKPGQVMMTYPRGAAQRAGIKPHDDILSINGITLTEREKLFALDESLRAGQPVTYRLRRNGTEFEKVIPLESPWPHPLMALAVTVAGTVSVAFVVIGLFVFSRAPMDRRSVVFHAMTTIGALSILAGALLAVDVGAMRGIVALPNFGPILLVAALSLLFVPLTLHLALVFPKDRPLLQRNPHLLRWVYGAPFASMLLAGLFFAMVALVLRNPNDEPKLVGKILDWVSGIVAVGGLLIALRIARRGREEGIRWAFWRRPIQSLVVLFAVFMSIARVAAALKIKWLAVASVLLTIGVVPLAVFFAYPVLSCILLWRSYRESGPEERRQVKWPLWGTLIAIGSKIVLSIATYVLMSWIFATGRDLTEWAVVTTVLSLVPTVIYLLIPISFAAAILKYRLMNIDVIIKKTVVYAILSGAIIVLYLVLVGGLGTILIAYAGLQNQTMVIASTLVVAALFVPLRNKLQHLVDRNLFRQKVDYPQALRAISADTLAASDLDRYLTAVAEKLQAALQNRAVVIFHRRESQLVAVAKIGVADSILGSVAVSAATADAIDRPLDPRRRELPESDAQALRKVGAALVVPVRTQSAVVALIALAAKLSDREFDMEDIEFVSSVADQMAIGTDRVRTQYDEADFEQARALQQTLLPSSAPQLEGIEVAGVWQPAKTVGGDYYDLLKLSETQLGICIGDVAGKGMPAALLMSALQAAVRASAEADVMPVRVTERVRRVVVPSLGGRFVSFFYCLYDAATKRLRYTNAGHNPPMVIRADGTSVRLSTGGPVLSRLFRDAKLEEGEVDLRPGDRLVLFTDGVSEARSASQEDFGEERLEEFVASNRRLGARELASSIVAAVLAYAGGRPEDDLTLVTMAVGRTEN